MASRDSGFHRLARQVHLKRCLKTIGDNRSLEGNLTGDRVAPPHRKKRATSHSLMVTNISWDHVNWDYKLQMISSSCSWDLNSG